MPDIVITTETVVVDPMVNVNVNANRRTRMKHRGGAASTSTLAVETKTRLTRVAAAMTSDARRDTSGSSSFPTPKQQQQQQNSWAQRACAAASESVVPVPTTSSPVAFALMQLGARGGRRHGHRHRSGGGTYDCMGDKAKCEGKAEIGCVWDKAANPPACRDMCKQAVIRENKIKENTKSCTAVATHCTFKNSKCQNACKDLDAKGCTDSDSNCEWVTDTKKLTKYYETPPAGACLPLDYPVKPSPMGVLMKLMAQVNEFFEGSKNKETEMAELSSSADEAGSSAQGADAARGNSDGQEIQTNFVLRIADVIIEKVLAFDTSSVEQFLNKGLVLVRQLIAGQARVAGSSYVVRFDRKGRLAPVFREIEPLVQGVLDLVTTVSQAVNELKALLTFPLGTKVSPQDIERYERETASSCAKSVDHPTEEELKHGGTCASVTVEDQKLVEEWKTAPVPLYSGKVSKTDNDGTRISYSCHSPVDGPPMPRRPAGSSATLVRAEETAASKLCNKHCPTETDECGCGIFKRQTASRNGRCVITDKLRDYFVNAVDGRRGVDKAKVKDIPYGYHVGQDQLQACVDDCTTFDWCKYAAYHKTTGQCFTMSESTARAEERQAETGLGKPVVAPVAGQEYDPRDKEWVHIQCNSKDNTDAAEEILHNCAKQTNCVRDQGSCHPATDFSQTGKGRGAIVIIVAEGGGRCSVQEQVRNAQRAGAEGVIVSQKGTDSSLMLHDSASAGVVRTPVCLMPESDVAKLKGATRIHLVARRTESLQRCYDRCILRKKTIKALSSFGGIMKVWDVLKRIGKAANAAYDIFKNGIGAVGTKLVETVFADVLEEFELFSASWYKRLGNPDVLAVTASATASVSFDPDPTGLLQKVKDEKDAAAAVDESAGPTLSAENKKKCLAALTGEARANFEAAVAAPISAPAPAAPTTPKNKTSELSTKGKLMQSQINAHVDLSLDISGFGASKRALSIVWEPKLNLGTGFRNPVPWVEVMGMRLTLSQSPTTMLKQFAVHMGTKLAIKLWDTAGVQVGKALRRAVVAILGNTDTKYAQWLLPRSYAGVCDVDYEDECKDRTAHCKWSGGACAEKSGGCKGADKKEACEAKNMAESATKSALSCAWLETTRQKVQKNECIGRPSHMTLGDVTRPLEMTLEHVFHSMQSKSAATRMNMNPLDNGPAASSSIRRLHAALTTLQQRDPARRDRPIQLYTAFQYIAVTLGREVKGLGQESAGWDRGISENDGLSFGERPNDARTQEENMLNAEGLNIAASESVLVDVPGASKSVAELRETIGNLAQRIHIMGERRESCNALGRYCKSVVANVSGVADKKTRCDEQKLHLRADTPNICSWKEKVGGEDDGECIVAPRFRRVYAGWRTKTAMSKEERLALINEATHAIPPGSTYKGKTSTLADAVFALTASVTGADPASDYTNVAVLELACPMETTVCGTSTELKPGVTFNPVESMWGAKRATCCDGSKESCEETRLDFSSEEEASHWYSKCSDNKGTPEWKRTLCFGGEEDMEKYCTEEEKTWLKTGEPTERCRVEDLESAFGGKQSAAASFQITSQHGKAGSKAGSIMRPSSSVSLIDPNQMLVLINDHTRSKKGDREGIQKLETLTSSVAGQAEHNVMEVTKVVNWRKFGTATGAAVDAGVTASNSAGEPIVDYNMLKVQLSLLYEQAKRTKLNKVPLTLDKALNDLREKAKGRLLRLQSISMKLRAISASSSTKVKHATDTLVKKLKPLGFGDSECIEGDGCTTKIEYKEFGKGDVPVVGSSPTIRGCVKSKTKGDKDVQSILQQRVQAVISDFHRVAGKFVEIQTPLLATSYAPRRRGNYWGMLKNFLVKENAGEWDLADVTESLNKCVNKDAETEHLSNDLVNNYENWEAQLYTLAALTCDGSTSTPEVVEFRTTNGAQGDQNDRLGDQHIGIMGKIVSEIYDYTQAKRRAEATVGKNPGSDPLDSSNKSDPEARKVVDALAFFKKLQTSEAEVTDVMKYVNKLIEQMPDAQRCFSAADAAITHSFKRSFDKGGRFNINGDHEKEDKDKCEAVPLYGAGQNAAAKYFKDKVKVLQKKLEALSRSLPSADDLKEYDYHTYHPSSRERKPLKTKSGTSSSSLLRVFEADLQMWIEKRPGELQRCKYIKWSFTGTYANCETRSDTMSMITVWKTDVLGHLKNILDSVSFSKGKADDAYINLSEAFTESKGAQYALKKKKATQKFAVLGMFEKLRDDALAASAAKLHNSFRAFIEKVRTCSSNEMKVLETSTRQQEGHVQAIEEAIATLNPKQSEWAWFGGPSAGGGALLEMRSSARLTTALGEPVDKESTTSIEFNAELATVLVNHIIGVDATLEKASKKLKKENPLTTSALLNGVLVRGETTIDSDKALGILAHALLGVRSTLALTPKMTKLISQKEASAATVTSVKSDVTDIKSNLAGMMSNIRDTHFAAHLDGGFTYEDANKLHSYAVGPVVGHLEAGLFAIDEIAAVVEEATRVFDSLDALGTYEKEKAHVVVEGIKTALAGPQDYSAQSDARAEQLLSDIDGGGGDSAESRKDGSEKADDVSKIITEGLATALKEASTALVRDFKPPTAKAGAVDSTAISVAECKKIPAGQAGCMYQHLEILRRLAVEADSAGVNGAALTGLALSSPAIALAVVHVFRMVGKILEPTQAPWEALMTKQGTKEETKTAKWKEWREALFGNKQVQVPPVAVTELPLHTQAVLSLERVAEQLQELASMKGSYLVNAVNLLRQGLVTGGKLADALILLQTGKSTVADMLGEWYNPSASAAKAEGGEHVKKGGLGFLQPEAEEVPQYIECPAESLPGNIRLDPVVSLTSMTLMPAVSILIPAGGVPVVLSLKIMGDFSIDIETASCKDVPVPGKVFARLQDHQTCSSGSDNECSSGSCDAVLLTCQPKTGKATLDQDCKSSVDCKSEEHVCGIGKCVARRPRSGATTTLYAAAPTLTVIVYTEFSVGIGIPFLSAGVYGRITVADLRVPAQIDVIPEYKTFALRVNPVLGALSGEVGFYAQAFWIDLRLKLFQWDGFSTRFEGLCRQFPKLPKQIAGSGAFEPRPLLCNSGAKHLVTARDHAANPTRRPSIINKCFQCEFQAGAIGFGAGVCGTWECPLAPERYAALAGTPNMVTVLDQEFFAKAPGIAENALCTKGKRKQVETMFVCGEEFNGATGKYEGYVALAMQPTPSQTQWFRLTMKGDEKGTTKFFVTKVKEEDSLKDRGRDQVVVNYNNQKRMIESANLWLDEAEASKDPPRYQAQAWPDLHKHRMLGLQSHVDPFMSTASLEIAAQGSGGAGRYSVNDLTGSRGCWTEVAVQGSSFVKHRPHSFIRLYGVLSGADCQNRCDSTPGCGQVFFFSTAESVECYIHAGKAAETAAKTSPEMRVDGFTNCYHATKKLNMTSDSDLCRSTTRGTGNVAVETISTRQCYDCAFIGNFAPAANRAGWGGHPPRLACPRIGRRKGLGAAIGEKLADFGIEACLNTDLFLKDMMGLAEEMKRNKLPFSRMEVTVCDESTRTITVGGQRKPTDYVAWVFVSPASRSAKKENDINMLRVAYTLGGDKAPYTEAAPEAAKCVLELHETNLHLMSEGGADAIPQCDETLRSEGLKMKALTKLEWAEAGEESALLWAWIKKKWALPKMLLFDYDLKCVAAAMTPEKRVTLKLLAKVVSQCTRRCELHVCDDVDVNIDTGISTILDWIHRAIPVRDEDVTKNNKARREGCLLSKEKCAFDSDNRCTKTPSSAPPAQRLLLVDLASSTTRKHSHSGTHKRHMQKVPTSAASLRFIHAIKTPAGGSSMHKLLETQHARATVAPSDAPSAAVRFVSTTNKKSAAQVAAVAHQGVKAGIKGSWSEYKDNINDPSLGKAIYYLYQKHTENREKHVRAVMPCLPHNVIHADDRKPGKLFATAHRPFWQASSNSVDREKFQEAAQTQYETEQSAKGFTLTPAVQEKIVGAAVKGADRAIDLARRAFDGTSIIASGIAFLCEVTRGIGRGLYSWLFNDDTSYRLACGGDEGILQRKSLLAQEISQDGEVSERKKKEEEKRLSLLLKSVDLLVGIVQRFASTRGWLHLRGSGRNDEDVIFGVLDEWAGASKNTGIVAYYGGVICSTLGMSGTRCVEWYIDPFLDTSAGLDDSNFDTFFKMLKQWEQKTSEAQENARFDDTHDFDDLEKLDANDGYALHVRPLEVQRDTQPVPYPVPASGNEDHITLTDPVRDGENGPTILYNPPIVRRICNKANNNVGNKCSFVKETWKHVWKRAVGKCDNSRVEKADEEMTDDMISAEARGCKKVCAANECLGTRTNPIPNNVQWEVAKKDYSPSGCCLGWHGKCDLCCPPKAPTDLAPALETAIFGVVLDECLNVRARRSAAEAYAYMFNKRLAHERYAHEGSIADNPCDAAIPGFPS